MRDRSPDKEMISYEDIKSTSGKGTPEIHLLTMFLYGYKPILNTVVEIGVATGGSSLVWQRFLSPDGILIGVDINLCDPKQFLYGEMEKTIEKFKNDKRVNFIIADSRAPETLLEVKRLLDGRPVDFLYIDGEHSYEGAKRDYEIYSPLVQSGGIIAFHDATCNRNVSKAIDDIVNIYYLKEKNLPFTYILRFDAKSGHCGIIALVKE